MQEIYKSVAEQTGLKPSEVKKVLDGGFAAIKSAAESGDKVTVPGLGSFRMKERNAGERTTKSGEIRTVEAARYVILKPSRAATGQGKKAKATTA